LVGTKKQAQDVIREEAVRASQFYVTSRWLGGTLTNFRTIKQGIDRLKALEKMAEDGTFERLPKKEVASLERERQKLERNLGGVKDMTRLPGCVFVIDPKKEHIAVHEASRLGIPVIGVVDTNCDPDGIDPDRRVAPSGARSRALRASERERFRRPMPGPPTEVHGRPTAGELRWRR